MTSNEIIVLTNEVGPVLERTPWQGLAIGAAIFVAVVLLVLRRTRTHDLRTAARPRRIVETAAFWSLAYTGMRAPIIAAHSGGPFGYSVELNLLLSAGLFMLLALLLVGTADLLLDALRPRRTPAWLLAGPLLLTGFSIGLLAASHWMDIFSADPGWRELMMTAGLLIAGLGWWSRLPGWRSQAADIFD